MRRRGTRCALGAAVAASVAATAIALATVSAQDNDGPSSSATSADKPAGAAVVEDSEWLAGVLRSALSPSADDAVAELLGPVLADPAHYRFQVLVSKVVTGEQVPRLERHGFRVDAEYIYPASAIKTCAAVAAVRALEKRNLPFDTPLVFQALFADQTSERDDPSNLAGGTITVQHEVRKLFLASDNRAYNRLFDLAGQREINELMWAAGLRSTRVQHRLDESRSREDQRRTPRIELFAVGSDPIEIPERSSDLELDNNDLVGIQVGRAYIDAEGELVAKPLSFEFKNWISLVDLQDLNVLLLRPEINVEAQGFGLTSAGRSLIAGAMAEFPSESPNPRYDVAEFPRTWGKYLLAGIERVLPPGQVLIANKVGRAYGFSIENAYVEDRASGRAFFVTAAVYTNANGVLNDGVYEYEQVAQPLFVELGEELARLLLTQ